MKEIKKNTDLTITSFEENRIEFEVNGKEYVLAFVYWEDGLEGFPTLYHLDKDSNGKILGPRVVTSKFPELKDFKEQSNNDPLVIEGLIRFLEEKQMFITPYRKEIRARDAKINAYLLDIKRAEMEIRKLKDWKSTR